MPKYKEPERNVKQAVLARFLCPGDDKKQRAID